MGIIEVDEFAKKLINQGMIQGRSNFAYRINGENKYVSKGQKNQYDTTPIHVDVNIVKDDILDIEAFKNSRPDATAPHVQLADESVFIGEAASSESYLVMHKIINACKITGNKQEKRLLN